MIILKCNAPFEKNSGLPLFQTKIFYTFAAPLFAILRDSSQKRNGGATSVETRFFAAPPQECHQHEWGEGRGAPTW